MIFCSFFFFVIFHCTKGNLHSVVNINIFMSQCLLIVEVVSTLRRGLFTLMIFFLLYVFVYQHYAIISIGHLSIFIAYIWCAVACIAMVNMQHIMHVKSEYRKEYTAITLLICERTYYVSQLFLSNLYILSRELVVLSMCCLHIFLLN